MVQARFLRDLSYASQPRLHAQLNIFTQVKNEDCMRNHHEIFAFGTMAEIDDALREGTISPFLVDDNGHNLCLFVSTLLLFVGAQ